MNNGHTTHTYTRADTHQHKHTQALHPWCNIAYEFPEADELPQGTSTFNKGTWTINGNKNTIEPHRLRYWEGGGRGEELKAY